LKLFNFVKYECFFNSLKFYLFYNKIYYNIIKRGNCDVHDLCVEGFVTNNAIANRLKIKMEELNEVSDDHPVWDDVSNCLAVLCVNICLIW